MTSTLNVPSLIYVWSAGPKRAAATQHYLVASADAATMRRSYRWWRDAIGRDAARIAAVTEVPRVSVHVESSDPITASTFRDAAATWSTTVDPKVRHAPAVPCARIHTYPATGAPVVYHYRTIRAWSDYEPGGVIAEAQR